MRLFNQTFALFLLFMGLASGALSQEMKPVSLATAPIPVDPEVRIGVLENGMHYFIKYNQKPEDRAELRLAVKAGSILEDEDQLGLAHFVEHMAFNGTKNFEKNELVDYLESTGVRFGPDLNAYTSFDETVYMLQARTDSLGLLETGRLIMEDWAGGITFDHEEIDKERGVVISEWRTRLSPDQRMQQEYFPVIYRGSQYAERLPIGDPKIVETADYETVKRFYRDWYRPDLMALVAVGDFDLDWMEREIKTRFSKLKNPESPRERKKYTVPKHAETLYSIASDKEAPFTQIRVMYKHDHVPTRDMEGYRAGLARNLYNRMLNARLFELQQQADPPFTFAYSGYGRDVGDLDTYFAFAFVAEGKINKGIDAVLTETKRAMVHGFTSSELERQKAELMKAVEIAFKEKDKTNSNQLSMKYVYHFLEDNPIPSPEQELELYKKLLPSIGLDEINKLPKEWITKENRVVVVTGPKKEEAPLPGEKDLELILREIDSRQVDPYEDKVSDAPLLSKELTPVAVKEENHNAELDVTTLILANGLRVVLKPTDFKNDEILFSAFSPGGHSLYADDDYQSASSAAAIVDMAGISVFSLTELQKKMAGKTINVSPYIAELYEGFNGNASPDDLETLFQLLYLYFTEPRKDADALQSFVTRQKSIVQNMMANPYYFFNSEKNKIKFNNHPRRQMTTMEDLDRISLDRAFEIYQDRFADASDFTFLFVGNFRMDSMREMVRKYLGNLPSASRRENWKNINADLVQGLIDTTIVRGQAPKALVEMVFHGDFEYTAQNRYDFYSLMDLLRIKLRESMREDKGGVYGVSINGSASQFPKTAYQVTISFNSEPDKAGELIATALKDIENVKGDGAEEKDMAKVRETQRQGRIKDLKENRFWSGQLAARLRENLPLEGISLESYEKYIDNLSSEALQKAAQRYFNQSNYMEFVLMPEEASESEE
jgi:zinc protease